MTGKTLGEIARIIGGELKGDSDVVISGITNIQDAGANDIIFAVPPNIENAAKSLAAAVIVPKDADVLFEKPYIKVENPRAAFARLLELFTPSPKVQRGVHELSHVAKSAVIGKNVAIMPFAFIDEDAVIGDDTIIYPHTYIGRSVKTGKNCIFYSNISIYADCEIGNNVIIHSGSVIGGDGFGFVTVGQKHTKVPQIGNVIVHDDVEIGCNTCIDCGTTGSTIIGKGTKIDNLVHVGHNDVIGENCFLVAHVGISGSVKVGNNCTFAGQAATVGHITIGNNCTFAGRSGITSDVPDNSVYAGFPAKPHKEWLKQEATQRRLPSLIKKIQELEKKLHQIESKFDS